MKQLFFLSTLCFLFFTGFCQTGMLDKSFGNGGLLEVSSGKDGQRTASVVLKDDKILVLNSTSTITRLTRFFPNGQVDGSFGKEGSQEVLINIYDLYSLTIQQDDKIVLASITTILPYHAVIVLLRYLPDGKPDSSFGVNGIHIDSTKAQTNAYDVVQQQDGKLVVCGNYLDDLSGEGYPYPLLTRYNEDGTPDKSFGDTGRVIKFGSGFTPVTIALQKDGKIICGGADIVPDACKLMRYNTDGSVDKTFGNNGLVETHFTNKGDYFTDIAINDEDKIVAVGTARSNDFSGGKPPLVAVARYNPDGSLDETFDKDGKTTFAFGTYDYGTSVALQPDGRIVVGGTAGEITFDYGIARLNTDGTFDKDFGTDGKTITAIAADAQDEPYQVGLQSTGNIILSGGSSNYTKNTYSTVLARYLGGAKDNSTPITKIKTWVQNHAVLWQPVYSSGNIDYYAVEKSKSAATGFYQVKKYEAETLPKPLVTNQTITYAYNLATAATANATTVSYYRIKAVYNNGNPVYSDVVSDSLLIQSNNVTISPNPVKDVMKISGLSSTQKTTITIVNRNGNVVLTATANSSTQSINVATLHSGVYDVVATSGGKTQTVKMVKE